MADVLNLKIKCRTAELTRVAEIGNKNWKVKPSKLIYVKGQI